MLVFGLRQNFLFLEEKEVVTFSAFLRKVGSPRRLYFWRGCCLDFGWLR